MTDRKDAIREYTWDTTDLFRNNGEFEKALSDLDGMISSLSSFEGKLGESFDCFRTALELNFCISRVIERLCVYAYMKYSEDGSDTVAQELRANSQAAAVKAETVCAFFEPELLSIDEKVLDDFMSMPGMSVYSMYIEDKVRSKAHILDKSREKLLAGLGDVSGCASDAFDSISDVDFVFPDVKDSDGKVHELTHGSFQALRENTDRVLRENAFNSFFGVYKQFNNTLASLYSANCKFDCYFSSQRQFDSALSAGLFGSNVPVQVYDSLCDTVHSYLCSMKKYVDLRAEIMEKNTIDMFDLYCPIVSEIDFSVDYNNAKSLVKRALLPLGDDYQMMLDRAFSERWIDVYENKGKATGAYSISAFGVHPYVLLNYGGTFDDVFTLAHELGHAMHSYYSDAAQEYPNHEYELTVAEVASTVNEVLLTLSLLKDENDKKRRAYILNHFLEGFRTTVFRQTLFAEFERKAHEMYENGTPLTAKALNDLYGELLSLYYNGVDINEIMKVEWSYIPHFYNSYYVWQYATGFCSAVTIAKRIFETGDAKGYLEFLSKGGREYPLDELRSAGIDLEKPDAVSCALRLFDSTIDDLRASLL